MKLCLSLFVCAVVGLAWTEDRLVSNEVPENVRACGAVGDGLQNDTQAFQRALDAGGVVRVPAGTYRIGTIYLRSHGGLEMDSGARLVASSNPKDWCNWDVKGRHYVSCENLPHLLVATNVENVVLRGGLIDGNNEAFLVKEFSKSMGGRNIRKRMPWHPHSMLFFDRCKGVRVENVSLRHSPFWNSMAQRCEDVVFRRCDVYSEREVPNNDGLEFLDCRNVQVIDSRIDTGDDAIGVFSNPLLHGTPGMVCENIVVSNCVIRSDYAHGIRMGVGSGEIRNCRFEDIRFDRSRNGIWVCSRYSDRPGRGGQFPGVNIHDLVFRNISGDCDQFVFVRHDYKFVLEPANRFVGEMRNVRFEGLKGTMRLPIVVEGNGVGVMSNIVFKDFAVFKADASQLTAEDCAFYMITADPAALWQTNSAADVRGM